MPETKDLLNDLAVPENATVGDDNLTPRDPDVYQVNESVPAQVMQDKVVTPDTVKVTETRVALDEIITDPSSPLAVQIPDAGRGNLDLPIHRLADAPKPEDVFAQAAKDDKAKK
jgi:hypothetical protein